MCASESRRKGLGTGAMLRDAAIRGDVAAVQNIIAGTDVDVNAALKVR